MWCLNMLYTEISPFQLIMYACRFSTIKNVPLALLDSQKPEFLRFRSGGV